MKRLRLIALLALVSLLGTGLVCAAPSVNVPVTAQVPDGTPDLSIVLKELTTDGQEPWTGTTVNSMDFGQLTRTLADGTDAGVWYSQKYYCLLIFTTSYGHRYEVKSTCTGLSSGGNSLPAGSFGVTPGYAKEDKWVWDGGEKVQGDMPVGAELGASGTAVVTDKLIYRSEPGASNRILRAFYSLPSYKKGGVDPFTGYTPIPLSQAAGTYSGTVTVTITAI